MLPLLTQSVSSVTLVTLVLILTQQWCTDTDCVTNRWKWSQKLLTLQKTNSSQKFKLLRLMLVISNRPSSLWNTTCRRPLLTYRPIWNVHNTAATSSTVSSSSSSSSSCFIQSYFSIVHHLTLYRDANTDLPPRLEQQQRRSPHSCRDQTRAEGFFFLLWAQIRGNTDNHLLLQTTAAAPPDMKDLVPKKCLLHLF